MALQKKYWVTRALLNLNLNRSETHARQDSSPPLPYFHFICQTQTNLCSSLKFKSLKSMAETEPSPGLIITNNTTIRTFLQNSISNPNLTSSHHNLASNLSSQTTIPYNSLRSLWFASPPSTRPNLNHLFNGSDFVFSSPKPREKSEELKARLKKLEEMAERKEYDELVRDITPGRDVAEPFSAYKDQLGFGLHVLLTMFTGYVCGYFAFRALFNHSAAMNAAGGILGLIIFMLVETFLFIIRSSNQDLTTSSTTTTTKKNQ